MQIKDTNMHDASSDDEADQLDFYDMGLDDRILKAIALLGWRKPTLIQEKAIPLGLDGNDILARARTGSGKTAVFAIPVINKILQQKQINTTDNKKTQAIIVAPSKELCKQLRDNFGELTSCCSREVKCVDVACGEVPDIKPLLVSLIPDIVIGTPAKILAHVQAGSLFNLKKTLQSFVVDEADLLFSFGFEKDMQKLIESVIPKEGCQSFLVSATLNPDVINLKNLVLRKPVIIKLEEPELPKCDQLAQYHISCQEDEKFVLLVALIKLNLLRGRTIIFVNSLKRCYKLKLFLEQFAIRSCLLNPELPVASRCNVVDQFNKGVYNQIIACDERCVHDPTSRKSTKKGSNGKVSRQTVDKDFAVSRGIDFQSVSNVINFDFPTSVTAYVHRVGRTARAINAINSNITEGTVLSFVAQDEHKFFNKVKNAFGDSTNFKPYAFKMEELEAFKYRAKDAIRAVTKDVIRSVRIKEIEHELKNSERLKSFLKSNPNDVQLLRHDRSSKRMSTQAHLKDVPDYIVPPTLKARQKQISVMEKRRLNNQAELTAPTSKKSAKRSSKAKSGTNHGKPKPMMKKKKKKSSASRDPLKARNRPKKKGKK
jgi:ATP-dependent RNA helicase DDX56/DBP9